MVNYRKTHPFTFPRLRSSNSGLCVSKCQVSWYVYVLSYVQLFATPWTIAHQAPLSMEFPRQEYWSGFPLPPPGDLPDTGIKASSFVSPALAGGFFTNSAMFINTNQLKKKKVKKKNEFLLF